MMIKDRAGSLGIQLTGIREGKVRDCSLVDLIKDFQKKLGSPMGKNMDKVRVNGNFAVHADKKNQDDKRTYDERCVESLGLVRQIAVALYAAT